jgi:protocatechuate 3,4-dioxygenase beta subunit
MIEQCIIRGALISGIAGMSENRLLAEWLQAETKAQSPTGSEQLGPFYKKGAPHVKMLRQPRDPGLPLRVTGNVWNTRGDILTDAVLDVWHADFYGKYDVQGYKYRAKLHPERDGSYSIETIMPGHYPDRPAQHLHYFVSAPGHEVLITQAYFATDPFFEGNVDKNYAKQFTVEHRENVRPVTLYEGDGTAAAAITFDIVLKRS